MSKIVKDSTAAIRVACAIVFLIFVFSYVYFFQTDLLAYAQHVWSGGQTHWNAEVGAKLFTLVLFIIYLGVSSLVKLPQRVYSLTFFPSLMMLGTITSMGGQGSEGNLSVGIWAWICAASLVVYLFLVRALSSYSPYETPIVSNSFFSEVSWTNFGILCLMMLMTCGIGNTDRAFHQQLKMERYVAAKKYDKAICMRVNERDVDSSMTMIRAYALSKRGLLGEKLFSAPITNGSRALLPSSDGSVRFCFHTNEMIWRHLGAAPREEIRDVKTFFKTLQKQHLSRPCVDEYLLSSYLLDKDLCVFAKEILRYYDFRTEEERTKAADEIEKKRKKLAKIIGEEEAADSIREVLLTPSGCNVKPMSELPKHFREALVLYTHIHSDRVLTYHDNVLDADYEDFLKVDRKKYKGVHEHDNALRDAYAGTYWYYYSKEQE